ncbi:chromosome segregation protein SMC [Desulforamulus aeronauticus]|uniref:Chromosome partition protein Smc n=1 Tax=Desulforamulus aeronauticus DSM 10349 TaxID=1121421 RepID=A0A1M6W1F0_9FIRM|nr:chromosome segregation protein SMC [Desulforamulus aeronauticus]SHK87554.1 condensin subunit Smc [Desulforamulus aeronauticus DSM 10349]
MCLKRVDIQGFKSFGDRIKLELHSGLSVVVGPNGSGKSNISDAISWCLGEQRASSLRGSRMEDVIFAGSDKRKAVGMAEVTLTLDNTAKLFSLPYGEIAVTRRLYRSGESEYLINKVPCRLKDIQALFMDTGLGRGAYSLIGQGKVDEILSSRPEERRHIIEEAAGIVKYRHRKEEALRKLSSAEQDLNRVSDIIHELGSRLEPLAAQAEQAKLYNTLQSQAWRVELSLYKREWDDLQTKAADIAQQLQQVKADFVDERPALQERLEQARNFLQIVENQIVQAREHLFTIESAKEKNSSQKALIQEQLGNHAAEQQRMINELDETREVLQGVTLELAAEQEKLNKLQAEVWVEKTSTEDEVLQQLEKQLEEKQELFQNLNTELIDQLNLVANQRNSKQQASDRKEQLAGRLKHLEKREEEAKENEAALQRAIQGASAQAAELTNKNEQLKSQKLLQEEEIKQIEHELAALQSKLAVKKEEMVAKHSRLKVLEENLSSHSGFMKPVRELLKAAEQGRERISGLCGAVADIIRVPKGFETAMEAALGGALQNLVCETSSQAKEAIEYLKRHGLGRATFLPLDSLRPTPAGEWEKKASGLTGVIGLAANLIEVDTKYRSVVELLMGRLVVVDTIENAITVARRLQQRVRIVTLAGELLQPGGSLSGGGLARNTGGMLHIRRERDELANTVKQLHQEIHQLTGQVTQRQQLHQQGLHELKQYQEQLVTLGLALQAAEMELNRAQEDLTRVNRRSEEGHWEKASIELEFQQWHQTETEAAAKLADFEQQLAGLQTKLAVTQEELTAAREKKAELENVVHRERIRQAELRQELIGVQKIADRLEQDIRNRKLAQATLEKSLENSRKRTGELQEQQVQLERAAEELTGQHTTAQEALQDQQSRQVAAIAAVKGCEESLQEFQQHWQQKSDKLHYLELQQTRLQTELELLTTRLEELGVHNPSELTVEAVASKRQARSQLAELREQITALGPVNAAAEAEYQEVSERHGFLQQQRSDLEDSKKSLQQVIEELNRLMSSQFTTAFQEINGNFSVVFQQLFGGGGATMSLTEGDTLTCGIDITARPPGKKNQNLSLLSGGERALTAIALLFAILRYKPSPFCVLDEIEASLDEANVNRFANYLSRTSEEVQFIVISHRKGTMEQADTLYGVTMDEAGVTRLLSMSLEEKPDRKRLA